MFAIHKNEGSQYLFNLMTMKFLDKQLTKVFIVLFVSLFFRSVHQVFKDPFSIPH